MDEKFKRSIESQMLEKHALTLDIGAIFTYDEMTRISGEPFPAKRHFWKSAMDRLETEHQVYFEAVPGVGYQRIPPGKRTYLSLHKKTVHIRRCSSRETTVLAAMDYEGLDKEERITHNSAMTIHAFLKKTTSGRRINALESAIKDGQNHKLTTEQTLKALGWNG
jgi:hypothetical protein